MTTVDQMKITLSYYLKGFNLNFLIISCFFANVIVLCYAVCVTSLLTRELLTFLLLTSSGGEGGKSSEAVQNPGGGGGKNWLVNMLSFFTCRRRECFLKIFKFSQILNPRSF